MKLVLFVSMVNNVAAQIGDCNGRPSISCEDH